MEDFEWPCCIRGYHIYKEIWDAAIGEHLACERENSNNHDRYAEQSSGICQGKCHVFAHYSLEEVAGLIV